jgi:hypothetical protein
MEQAGIYSLKLYDTSDTTFYWIDEDNITITAGTSLDIISENKPRITYSPIKVNRKLKFNYNLEIQLQNLTNTTINTIKDNKHGWYVVYTLNNGTEQAILTPFFIDEPYTLNTNQTNNRILNLKPNRVSDKFKEVKFSPVLLNPLLWVDSTIGVNTSDVAGTLFVDEWKDQSGNGNDLIQTLGANRPVFENNEITFDGISQYLTFKNVLSMGSTHTVVWVKRLDGIQDASLIGGAPWGGLMVFRYKGLTTDYYPSSLQTVINVDLSDNIYHVNTLQRDSLTANFYKDDIKTVLSSTNLNAGDNPQLYEFFKRRIANDFFVKGAVKEFLLFDYTLTDDQIGELYNYEKNKYGF